MSCRVRSGSSGSSSSSSIPAKVKGSDTVGRKEGNFVTVVGNRRRTQGFCIK